MSIFKQTANSANAPKVVTVASTGAKANTYGAQANVSNGAKTVGLYGIDVANTQSNRNGFVPGWNVLTRGTGHVKSYTIANSGNGSSHPYTNTDTITVSGGIVNATATITTDGNGLIVAVTKGESGNGFVNASSITVTINTSTGQGANIVANLGGRAGRLTSECLSALKSLIGDGTVTIPTRG